MFKQLIYKAMPIKHVMSLYSEIEINSLLRDQMYLHKNPTDLMNYLKMSGFDFTLDEFEDATNILHLQCQSYEEADALLQKADWLRFQISTI